MVLDKILKMENALVAGFLYHKLSEAEKAGVKVRYKVDLKRECPVSEVQLIEVIGNLFDHAMAKFQETKFPEKKIYFKLQQKEENVTIKFAYISEMLSMDKLTEMWNNTGKGAALYRLKQLAENDTGKILFRMKTVDGVNYLCIKVNLPCKIQAGKHIFRICKVDSL